MTIFSKIIKGDIPSYKIAENDQFYAFLDIFPMMEGHTLIVPKVEVDKFFDVPTEYLNAWLAFAKPIAAAIESVVPCNRVGISVMGLEVPHAHMHLIPINSADDMNFTRAKLKLEPSEFQAIQAKIIAQLPATL
ncbi:histidine triad (HIT) family protein [Chitinophaga skermanii]|uniref:Histidine triad (HIT) family protein n=1 Tax=Chitinophaga skermanii TaxID=331697 RepID=A0A327QHY5_9BACT|nr:HIT family protein [Chitinophaga skermanii]RAJ04169.1 histidine triad (HIT) family protein [Chitinophaga skermanii]